MSGRVKTRAGGSSAALEQATLSVNERILKECHTLYTEPDKGNKSNQSISSLFKKNIFLFLHFFLAYFLAAGVINYHKLV